nr:ORFIII-like polyprotein [Tanacetum cinerariifolium]
MFDYDVCLFPESDESCPPSSLYDRFQPSDGYHVFPPSYRGTFMPPKPDLVFNTAPTTVETDHSAFNVQLSSTKPDQDLSHTNRPTTPIIEDWVSDSKDKSKTKAPQIIPSFVQSTEQVKSPRYSVQHVETFIPAATPKPASPKPTSNGKRRNRKACFVCKSLDHLIIDCDYHEKKMAKPTARNHAHRGNHKQYALLTHPNPQKKMVPTIVLTQSKLVSITAVRPVSTYVPKFKVTRPRHATPIVTKTNSPIRRHITSSPSLKASNFPPRVTAVKALVVNAAQGNMSYLSDFKELNGGYVAFGGKFKGKVDEGFLVGYSVSRKAFRVFNSRTRIVQETLHVNFLENKPNVTGNQSNPSAGFQDKFDAEKAGEEIDQQYVLFPVWSSGFTNPHNTNRDVAFDGKEPEFDAKKPESKVIVSPSSRYRDLSAKFEDYSDNSINEVNTAGTLVPTVGQISLNSTNTFSATEADFNNLETSIIVSPIPTTRVHKDHPVTQIIGDMYSTTQTRSMARVAKDQVYQMDVKSAFLYGTIEEEVYVCQPPVFEDPNHSDKVYKVVKGLYGLHQALRACVYSISEGEGDTYQNISVMVQDTPIEEIAFRAIEEDDESYSDEKEEDYQLSHHAFMFHPGPPTKIAEMVQTVGSWKPNKELPVKSKECEHDWKENTVTNYTICYYYGILTTDMSRLNCPKCQLTTCTLCARNYLGITVNVKGKQPQKLEEEKNFSNDESKESLLIRDLTDALKTIYQLRIEKERLEEQKDEEIKKLKAQLQKRKEEVEVEFDIPDCSALGTTAIIDTRASVCCINKKVVPKEALEPLTDDVFFNGLNSRQRATHKIKQGYFLIEGNKFRIPLIYAFDMNDSNEIAELEVNEEKFLEINESIYFNQEGSKAFLEQFKPVIERLKHQGYIGEEPLKHRKKNGELYKLDIINPVITIEDRPLKHVTPAMEDSFRRHVDSLLKIGAIRPSKSRHRTMAMIVNSRTIIDPVMGKEVKGKERMVFNYKSLNDNTYKDQYSLPGINTIIKRIGGAKIFSKFDLKSGFHQVAMDEESILWTAFLVPGGLYEWLVMPFGLKNAQAVFQREMDKCFKGTESFIAVYIDDILVFLKNEKEHSKHLERMLKICEDNGLVLSSTKIKIAVSTVDFLGAVIGEGTIKLQPHIIKKIVNFNEEELKTKKGLRSFLGILNYARTHILKLEILLRPLYEKTNAHEDKRMKPSDYDLVRKIKEQVQNLPDLEIPPENAYTNLEKDGCMEGWRGVVKWKKKCTGEIRELAAAALYSVEEVLQSPNAFQKNMKITCEEVMKISNHFQESSQKLSSHMKNQEHYTDATSLKPTKPQSEWINLMHVDQSLKTLNYQQQKKQSKQCGTYKQSYNAKPKYALDNQPKTTNGQIKEKMFEFKTRKPEESLSNWKPWHRDWDTTTSNFLEDDASNDDNKYRYNRKNF